MTGRANDLGLYDRHASEWWDDSSRVFRSLRSVKRYQLERIARILADAPVRVVLELGCGGGLLAVPLGMEVERVVGLDLSASSLATAREQAARAGARCAFVTGDLRNAPFAEGAADLVVLSDVVEHVGDPGRALAEAARLARAGGFVYVNTINSTRTARVLAVTLAEGVGLMPRGTHDPRLFLAPEELIALGARAGLVARRVEGESPRWLRTLARRSIHMRASRSTRVTYNVLFEKKSA